MSEVSEWVSEVSERLSELGECMLAVFLKLFCSYVCLLRVTHITTTNTEKSQTKANSLRETFSRCA